MKSGFNPERNDELEARLDELLTAYRGAFDEPEPKADFMPRLWARIEARRESQVVFAWRRWAQAFVGLAAVASLFMVLLQVMPGVPVQAAHGGYIDQLSEEAGPDQMLYRDMARAENGPKAPQPGEPDGANRR